MRTIVARSAAGVAALFVIYSLLPLAGRGRLYGVVVGGVLVALAVPVMINRVRAVATSHHPLLEAAAAILVTVSLLVVGPAATYYTLATSDPAAFNGLDTKLDAIYFAVVIITTVGFGDIVPVSQLGRLVVTVNLALAIVLLGVSIRLMGWAAKQGSP